jgi:hypothetical protein
LSKNVKRDDFFCFFNVQFPITTKLACFSSCHKACLLQQQLSQSLLASAAVTKLACFSNAATKLACFSSCRKARLLQQWLSQSLLASAAAVTKLASAAAVTKLAFFTSKLRQPLRNVHLPQCTAAVLRSSCS